MKLIYWTISGVIVIDGETGNVVYEWKCDNDGPWGRPKPETLWPYLKSLLRLDTTSELSAASLTYTKRPASM